MHMSAPLTVSPAVALSGSQPSGAAPTPLAGPTAATLQLVRWLISTRTSVKSTKAE